MSSSLAAVTAERLARFDRPGPRFTSYPTAVEFHDGFTPQRYLQKPPGVPRRSAPVPSTASP
jgi:oxygen-independent coproporphyrinogen III oxidase